MDTSNRQNPRRRRRRGGPQQQQQNGQNQNNRNRQNNRGKQNRRGNNQPPRGQRPRGQGGGGKPSGPPVEVRGVLELDGKSGGFLRSPEKNYSIRADDPFVTPELISKFGLRGGEMIAGSAQRIDRGNRNFDLTEVETIEEIPRDEWQPPTPLSESIAVDPDRRIEFDTKGGPMTVRVLDLFTPIGFGQRGLIVAPPRTGKTVLMQHMAHGVAENHPEAYMIVLLIDERPEEVTDMRRNVRGEVIASSNDEDTKSHVRIARLVIERAKRLAEQGRDIVVLLDSITRLARAFNSFVSSSGRTMTGGLDIKALQEPKQIFGAARAIEGGGSLTIIGTALVETGSRADDFIFQEFKGTGNMELKLDRDLANLRIWPAVDLGQSGTRKEEKLLGEAVLEKQYKLRRQLSDMPKQKAIPLLTESMAKTDSLAAFLDTIKS